MQKKRAMSDVPITIIMISLAIFLIGLLWVVLVNVFNSSPGEIIDSFKDLSSDLKIESVLKNPDGSYSVSVKKSQGKARLSRIIFFISDDENTKIIERESNLGSNEKASFSFSSAELESLSFVRNVSVVPFFDTKEVSGTIEDATDTFEFSNKDILKNLGAVSWYGFEDNLLDGVGINNGIISNTYSFSDGKSGKSISFNGIGDYADFGNLDYLDGKNSFAISFWIYSNEIDKFSHDIGIFSRGTNNSQSPWIYGYKNTRSIFAQFKTSEATADCSLGTNPIGAKQWNHIVFVWDGKECKFYENGKSTNKDPTKGTHLVNVDSTTLVGKTNDGGYFDGKIDNLVIFDKSIDENTVKILNEIKLV